VKGFLGLKLIPLNKMQVEGEKISYYYLGEGYGIKGLNLKSFKRLSKGFYLLKGTLTERYFYFGKAVKCGKEILKVNEFELEGEVKRVYPFADCLKVLVELNGREKIFWLRIPFPLTLFEGEEIRAKGELVKAKTLFLNVSAIEVLSRWYPIVWRGRR